MGSFTGDMLRILAGGGMNLATNLIGQAITMPLKTRSEAKILAATNLLKQLPMMTQPDAAATAEILDKIAGTQVVPRRMAETGNVVGPTGETLAMTPMPGAPVTPEMKERFVVGTPTLDQLKAQTFASMSPDEQKRTMKAIETLGQVAAMENALTARNRYNAMYGPGGVEWGKLGVAQGRLPIAQQQADAATQNAQTSQGQLGVARDRVKLDTRGLEEVQIPAMQSLKDFRQQSIALDKANQKAKTAQDKLQNAFEMLKQGNAYLKTYNDLDENIRKRNLKRPADLDSHLADAEAMRDKATRLIAEGFRQLSPEEQQKYKDQAKQAMIPEMIENARNGHVPTQEKLKALGIPWE